MVELSRKRPATSSVSKNVEGRFPVAKNIVFPLIFMCACTADVFVSPDSDVPEAASDASPALRSPPRDYFRRGDAGAVAIDAGDELDASAPDPCTPTLPDASPFCATGFMCAPAEGGMICDVQSNASCVFGQGLYAECLSASDCPKGRVCAVVNETLNETACPPTFAASAYGPSISCTTADTVGSAHVMCRTSADCGDAGICKPHELIGFASLAGAIVGVCD